MISRFSFHPVGEGLIYSGQLGCYTDIRFFKYNFIYDCGGDESFIAKAVDNFCGEIHYRKINLCIISHLHKDHYNGLQYLKERGFSIDKIVLPYLLHSYEYKNLRFVYIEGQYFEEQQDFRFDEVDISNVSRMLGYYNVYDRDSSERETEIHVWNDFEKESDGYVYFKHRYCSCCI